MKSKERPMPTPNKPAEGKTQISISLPNWLIEAVDGAAAAENRNRSNYIATVLVGKLTLRADGA